MKKIAHSKPLCILFMISMLVLGFFCEDIRNDPSFSYASGEFCAVSLQSTDHLADTHVYYEKGSSSLMEEFVLTRQSVRTPAGLRIHLCVLSALLMVSAYLFSLFFRYSNLCCDGFDNQYHRRTVEYIHRNDGKKSQI